MSASPERVLVFLNHETGCAFAHHESVAFQVERTACTGGWISIPAAHSLNEVERTKGQRGEGSFRSSCDYHICHSVADIAKCFTHRHHAAGAGVRVSSSHSPKS